MTRFLCLLTILLVFTSACTTPPTASATAAPASMTASPSPSPAPSLTPTPAPASPTPTPLVIEGTLTIKVNVRSGPGTTYDSLGQLDSGEKVRILFRDPTGKWYRILYPVAKDGYGWVTAQYVQIPVWTQVPLQATPIPAGPSGRVLQRLNVRSGPGTMFDSLGLLEPDTTVFLTGKNSTASWLQIVYPTAPGGHGWVTAQYIQADASGLPVLDDYGTPVLSGTQGPTPIPVTPTPTTGPAYLDNDSAANPGVSVTFSASGTRQFTYSSQVSTPQGDPADWVEFTPYAPTAGDARLIFSLACSGNGTLTVELWQGGSLSTGWGTLACGDADQSISLPAGRTYQLHLVPVPGSSLILVNYVLTVQNLP